MAIFYIQFVILMFMVLRMSLNLLHMSFYLLSLAMLYGLKMTIWVRFKLYIFFVTINFFLTKFKLSATFISGNWWVTTSEKLGLTWISDSYCTVDLNFQTIILLEVPLMKISWSEMIVLNFQIHKMCQVMTFKMTNDTIMHKVDESSFKFTIYTSYLDGWIDCIS